RLPVTPPLAGEQQSARLLAVPRRRSGRRIRPLLACTGQTLTMPWGSRTNFRAAPLSTDRSKRRGAEASEGGRRNPLEASPVRLIAEPDGRSCWLWGEPSWGGCRGEELDPVHQTGAGTREVRIRIDGKDRLGAGQLGSLQQRPSRFIRGCFQ